MSFEASEKQNELCVEGNPDPLLVKSSSFLLGGEKVVARTFSESPRIHSSAKVRRVSVQQVGNPWATGGR